MSRIKQEEEIRELIKQAEKDYKVIADNYDNVDSIEFRIDNCSVEAMREVAGGEDVELDFWDSVSKMVHFVSYGGPQIVLFSPEIEVEKHKVDSYAYKNV